MKTIRSTVEVLSPAELELIHRSTLELLESVGLHVPCREVLNICREHGAVIDPDTEVMKIPASVMEAFLSRMRADCRKQYEADLENREIRGGISTQVFFIDYGTDTRRYGLRDDNLKGFALVDTLECFGTNNPVVVPSDVPYPVSDVISFADMFKYAKKPGGTYILTPKSAKYIIELCRLMGREAWYLLETISPLSFKKDSLEMALQFAKAGQNLSIGPMVMGGSTGPVTPAGTMTLENTEVLASLFIVHALTGKYSWYSAPVHSTDPTTMLCSFGSPNQAYYSLVAAQLSRYYGIAAMTNAALTDAMRPDFQAGIEKGILASVNFLAGCRSMGAQGIVGADQGNSLEQLVLDNEWMRFYNYIMRGFEVTQETIGLDTIKEVGIRGNFLAEDHTVEHLRESFLPSSLFPREDWASWINGGKRTVYDRAHEYVTKATAECKDAAPRVSASVCEEIDRITAAAEKEILG